MIRVGMRSTFSGERPYSRRGISSGEKHPYRTRLAQFPRDAISSPQFFDPQHAQHKNDYTFYPAEGSSAEIRVDFNESEVAVSTFRVAGSHESPFLRPRRIGPSRSRAFASYRQDDFGWPHEEKHFGVTPALCLNVAAFIGSPLIGIEGAYRVACQVFSKNSTMGRGSSSPCGW